MIARMWHGAVPSEKAADYYDYLQRTGVTDYESTPGNRGVYILQREENGVTHFHILTFWESYDAIRAFAGDDYEKARYYPEDTAYLLELEPLVMHYEVRYP